MLPYLAPPAAETVDSYRFEPKLPAGVKPTGPVVIDWENELTHKLASCILVGNDGNADLVRRELPTLNGSNIGHNRGALSFGDASWLGYSQLIREQDSTHTILLHANNENGSAVFGMADPSQPDRNILLAIQAGDGTGFYWYRYDTNTDFSVAATTDVTGDAVVVSTSSDEGTFALARLYMNGVQEGVKGMPDEVPVSALDNFTVGALRDSTPTNSTGGTIYSVMMWDRTLTAAEVARISRNPYQFLKPVGPPIPITTPKPELPTYEYTIPDPRWEAPAIMVPGVKPTGPVVIDWGNWAGGLISGAYLPLSGGGVHNLARGIIDDGGTLPSMAVVANHGIGGDYNGTSNYTQLSDLSETYFGDETGSATLILIASWTGAGTNEWAFSAGYSGSNNPIVGIIKEGANVRFLSRGVTPNTHYDFTGTATVNDGKPHVIVVTFNRLSGGAAAIYVDGSLDNSASLGATDSAIFDRLTLGALERATVGAYFGGQIYFAAHMDGVELSEEQAADISRNPYQFLIPA